MKKGLSLILCVIMMVSLFSGCNKNESTDKTGSDSSSSSVISEDKSTEINNNDTLSNNSSNDGKTVEESFFDDAVFVGDSVTLKLSYYVDFVRNNVGLNCLGKSKFLCSGSLGFANSLWDMNAEGNVHPYYEGTQYLIADGVKATGAKKVFLMLGINDFSLYGTDATIDNAKTVVDKILEKNPDAEIYIQSLTPMIQKVESGDYNNVNIRILNDRLKELCKEKSWKYLDIASIMTDENGYLKPEYCSDPDSLGIHFTNEACEKWVDYLMNNAG